MSWTGQCIECAQARLAENITGLRLHYGEPLRRWRHGVIRAAGGIIPDE